MDRIVYDCDTYDYWCSDEDYEGKNRKHYGDFIDDGKAYEIIEKDTPRPWLNYLCNDKIASVISNTGMGFYWYKTSLLRVTKYEHIIDYQPRTFEDGREVWIKDLETGKEICVFRDAEDIKCVHSPGKSVVTANIDGFTVSLKLFVPKKDAAECWRVSIKSETKRNIEVSFKQVWTVARFGIHTAEEGIPYLSIPGKDQIVETIKNGVLLKNENDELPVKLKCAFLSSENMSAQFKLNEEIRKDGRKFIFTDAILSAEFVSDTTAAEFNILSAAEEDEIEFNELCARYRISEEFDVQEQAVMGMWEEMLEYPSCNIPDKNIEKFLNIWLKNQLYVTFRYVRSGYIGYRDTIQDSWGYTLLEPDKARERILNAISFMNSDGTCPRNFSPFGKSDNHDMRNTMDSATWIGMCINDYICETGDTDILNEEVPYLDSDNKESVLIHIKKAMDMLYKMRGRDGFCLVVDGDWNDAIEGISNSGPAVSIWLTMAFYFAQKQLAEVFDYIGDKETAELYRERNEELYKAINEYGWDGEWYRYAISGNGDYVGSKENEEGKIHLNSNTWAVFTGLADKERSNKVFKSIDEHLSTFVGPALLAPPYRKKPCEVGRIVNLEPGTFENGSVYQHAVCFYIYALLAADRYEEAYEAYWRLLPTNPENFDSKRSSEPYCTGNYYCGPSHKRAGQNFFTWFTGTPAWLMRAGFDEILGVKACFEGLKLSPKVPKDWNNYEVCRKFRDVKYHIVFERGAEKKITVNGKVWDKEYLLLNNVGEAEVHVTF